MLLTKEKIQELKMRFKNHNLILLGNFLLNTTIFLQNLNFLITFRIQIENNLFNKI